MLVVDLPHFINSVGMELVKVPTGSFTMGSETHAEGYEKNEQLHSVTMTIRFSIGCTEVTREQFRSVMGWVPGEPDAAGDLPVDGVTWDDARAFCEKLSTTERRTYRLPTEAEWEYACRAGTATPIAGTARLDEMAWHIGNSGDRLRPVGTKHPNHWGLRDMHGNAAEWCLDDYVPYLGYDPKTNPFQETRRGSATLKGGSAIDFAGTCRAAWRNSFFKTRPKTGVGFRVVMAPMPTTLPAHD
jgi:formylglycine-generating enzyme required for sulfatase activity